jgi:hypothetical protein
VIAFRQAVAAWDFAGAAAVAERLMPVVEQERRWISADELRDGLVIARLHLRDPAGARRALDTLGRFTVRSEDDLRSRLLSAYVTTAETLHSSSGARTR